MSINLNYLDKLRSRYQPLASDDIDPLAAVRRRHAALKRTRLLDLAAIATSLAWVDRPELDELALKTIQDTNPSFDPSQIGDYSSEEWTGIVNAAKGKYFEYQVVERLNAGETVGDLYLRDGETARLAESMNQPGWDISVVDASGKAVEFIQLKATDSVSYVRDALERYPDIKILATDEAADHLGQNSMVLDANMSDAQITQAVDQTLQGLEPGVMDEFWAAFNPLLPLLIIAGTQGYQVALGKQTVRNGLADATERAKRGLVGTMAGAIVKALTGSFLLAIPAGLAASFWYDGKANADALARTARDLGKRQKARLAYWNIMRLSGS